mmetsp:Transcript_20311/g.36681  ORF Transcript_20311/g.36681 Transcript_20311/m.36681 type:complete len:377 (+) Transcript_20311:178-1308(+)|eukprot:CAMPEP_0202004810 /NCGR_PEP_ID=MMETSP0905-20130828/10027_1 /ASSEMBLY_ACC=CAM_ASM_000554 /TAXON_ID=420261 /ORGANISM="Thalassiosira antarctica, Strain CCMP982" /LENGTH=376 /DNA_ID=CAMNT_0048562243 /DNA_START=116 /DNA_END=1246 /DNA_ORIENTATION=-
MIGSRIFNQPSCQFSRNLLKTRRCGEGTFLSTNSRPHPSSYSCHSNHSMRRVYGRTFRNQSTTAGEKIVLTESQAAALAQRRAYEFYRKKNGIDATSKSAKQSTNTTTESTLHERNVKIASYAAATVIGALGATYAAVPLYKIFCQTTGFGGTTQRVQLTDWAETQESRESSGRGKVSQALWDKLLDMSNVPREMLPGSVSGSSSHGRGSAKTWTDEEAAEKLASLRPRKDGKLITVRFDSTVGDVLPWSFIPAQLDVKVVPGETALSFFTATNHSDKAITGVATYNVHPPKVGLYFSKIQCFCFEEQRLLPGETVDMPVFFFIDPEIMDDPQLKNVNNVTLSYTFFQTDMDYDDDEDDDEEDEEEKSGVVMKKAA